MNFEKIILEIEKYESLDIIAASGEQNPTEKPEETVAQYDPYANDKW